MSVRSFDRLNAVDRGFLDIEDHNLHMHVGSVAIFEISNLRNEHGGVDIERLRAYVLSRLHRVPRYRQRIAYTPIERHPVWVDDPFFNINYHVRHTALPRPGDERQLKRLAGRLMSQQLDRGKPLWELWVVEGLDGDRFALVSKVHHCMIDGISGAEILQQLFSVQPQNTYLEPRRHQPRPLPPSTELLMSAAGRSFSAPTSLVRAATKALVAPRTAVQKTLRTVPAIGRAVSTWSQSASVTPINRPIGPHRRFDWLAMDLQRVRAVKSRMNGSVNDVVLTVVARAMTRFLIDRGIDAAAQQQIRFRVFCPVSLRTEAERGTLGNRVAMTIVDLPIGRIDPQGQLDRIRGSFKTFRDSNEALGADALASMSEWIAPSLASLSVRLSYKRHAGNLIVTNVPGPQVELYLLGARMLETYPVVPLFIEQCVGIALFSYAGGLYWGLNADWETMPDLHDLTEDITESFAELEAHVGLN